MVDISSMSVVTENRPNSTIAHWTGATLRQYLGPPVRGIRSLLRTVGRSGLGSEARSERFLSPGGGQLWSVSNYAVPQPDRAVRRGEQTTRFGSVGRRVFLYAVSANGGEPRPVTTLGDGERFHHLPRPLPNGSGVLFTVNRGASSQIAVHSQETGEHHVLADGSEVQFAPSGHLVFRSSDGELSALRFDPETLEAVGDPAVVFTGVRLSPLRRSQNAFLQFHITDDGSLGYVAGSGEESARSLVWVDRDGKEEVIESDPAPYVNPRISPDGQRIAVEIAGGNQDIWILDLTQNTFWPLTTDPTSDNSPLWTPSGDRIVFSSDRQGPEGLYWTAADGTGRAERLVDGSSDRRFGPYSFSSDGQHLVVESFELDTGYDVGLISIEGEREWQPLLAEAHWEVDPALSPDGRWLALLSFRTGISVRPFPDGLCLALRLSSETAVRAKI